MIKTALLLIAFSISTTALAADAPKTSFDDLAKIMLLQEASEITQQLEQVNEESLPRELKAPRKKLGLLKIKMDIFQPVYKTGGDFSSWRKFIDDGYTVLGDYKDLYDSNPDVQEGKEPKYDKKTLSKYRKPMLKWLKKLKNKKDDLLLFLETTEAEFQKHSKKDSGRFIWARSKSKFEDISDSEAILKQLLSDMTAANLKDLAKVLDIKKLTSSKGTRYHDEETFHDFRKGLRSIVKVSEMFPALMNENCHPSLLESFIDVISQFGDLNDKIMSFKRMKIGSSKFDKKRKEVEKGWDEIRDALEDRDLDKSLINYIEGFEGRCS